MKLDALVAPLRADVVSGAAVVARAAADAMRRGAIHLPAETPEELVSALETLALRVMDAQPAMAPLVELLTSVLEAGESEPSVDGARRAAAEAAEAFRERLEDRSRTVAEFLARELPRDATVLTLSSSSTVRSGLLEAKGKGIRAICLEGRPMNEGQGLARTLAQAGIPVTLAVDAAAQSLLGSADLVLLGADSVGDSGVVNKIGSLGLALGARDRAIPVWVAADRSKWLPTGFPQRVADDRPAEEVWRGARGVRVWNRYFETLAPDLVQCVITDSGPLTPGELDEARQALRAAPVLRKWAGSRHDEEA